MKKLLSIMILLAGVISFTSCGDDDTTYTAPAQLSLKSADAFYEAAGGTGSIVVNSSEALTATSNVDWLTVAVSGNTVNLTVAANDKLEGRSTNVQLKTATASKEVNITQRGIIYGISEYVFEVADTLNSSVSVPVAQSAGVTVKSLAEWLTASFNKQTSEIEVVAASNDEEEVRYGLVAFQTGSIQDTIVIVQKGMLFNVEKTSIAVPNAGSVETVTIEHSRPVTIASSANWFECAFNDETGVLTISVKENPGLARQGTITLKSVNSEKTISIIQYDPATLADQIVGDYYFVYYDENNEMKYFGATLTEDALQIPALNWSIPVTIDKEKLTVSVKSGCFVGTYSSYFIYMLFVDETDEIWTADDTESVVTLPLALEDIGGGNLTLAGLFEGTFGEENDKFGSFFFGAFSEQTLDMSKLLGGLLQMYTPGLMKIPAETDEAAAAAMAKRRVTKISNVPFYLKKRTR